MIIIPVINGKMEFDSVFKINLNVLLKVIVPIELLLSLFRDIKLNSIRNIPMNNKFVRNSVYQENHLPSIAKQA